MEEAKKLGAKKIIIRGDSELIIKQMPGQYRVKHPDMKVLYDEAHGLSASSKSAKIEHNLRHKNELADKLANLAMDRRAGCDRSGRLADRYAEPDATEAGDRFNAQSAGVRSR